MTLHHYILDQTRLYVHNKGQLIKINKQHEKNILQHDSFDPNTLININTG